MMVVKVLAGAVWKHCSLSEYTDVSARDDCDLVAVVAAELWWLPSEEAEKVTIAAVNRYLTQDPTPTLAGYCSSLGELAPVPPEGAEPLERNAYGHSVYVEPRDEPDPVYDDVCGVVWEPYYIAIALCGGERECNDVRCDGGHYRFG